MVAQQDLNLYETAAMRKSVGDAIRPGGTRLTVRALEFCRFAPGQCLLDIGCGLGVTVRLMSERYQLDACGIDSSESIVAGARSRAPGLPFSVADAQRLPFPDGQFDGAIMECSLSVIDDARRALLEARRVLKSGKRLVISDLYRRESSAASLRLPGGSCLAGAQDRETNTRELEAAGFRTLLWEDRTPLLRDLASELIAEHGSLERFWATVLPVTAPDAMRDCDADKQLGYYLAIAEKAELP